MKKIILLLAACCVALSPALAAQRVVVAEDLTGTWCQYCPAAANGLDQLHREVGDSLIVLALHGGGGGDPFQTTETQTRINWYGISGYPTVIFDGTTWMVGSDGSGAGYNNYNYYRPLFDSLKLLATPVTMAMRFTSLDIVARTGQAEIKAVNTGPDTVRATLQFAIIERDIPIEWQGMHQADFVVHDLMPDQNGEAVVIAPGDSVTALRSFSVDPSWYIGACCYTAFLQQGDRTIIQGAQIGTFAPRLTQQRYTLAEVGNNDGYFEPGETGRVAVWVRNNDLAAGSGAVVRMETDDPYVAVTAGQFTIGDMQPDDSTNNAGSPFTFDVLPTATMPEGHRVKLMITKNIYSSMLQDTVTTRDSVFVTVGSPTVIFSDSFEGGAGSWVVGKVGSDTTTINWDTTSADSHSPGFCVTDSRWGNYKRGIFRYIAMAESLDLTPYGAVTLTWWEKYATQPSADYCRPQYTINNGSSWVQFAQYSGSQPAWQQRGYDLSAYTTSDRFKLRFLLSSNADTVTADGWYVDDVVIMGYTKAGVAGRPVTVPFRGGSVAVSCYPNPSPGAVTFAYTVGRPGMVDLSLYDVCGRLVTTLVNAPLAEGGHAVRWNGVDRSGRKLSSGVYFFRLSAGGRTSTGKITLIK